MKQKFKYFAEMNCENVSNIGTAVILNFFNNIWELVEMGFFQRVLFGSAFNILLQEVLLKLFGQIWASKGKTVKFKRV